MRILHTESSLGWGGQEIRILRESEGMRARGHVIIFATSKRALLAKHAREAGFVVYVLSYRWAMFPLTLCTLIRIILKHKIGFINTHSSRDSWIGGIAARFIGRKIIRTRHLSTPIRRGLNSHLLFNLLADFVVTTSSNIIPKIMSQAALNAQRIQCIPTGVDPKMLQVDREEIAAFRSRYAILPEECLIGTCCVVRSWKGVEILIEAAERLRSYPSLKWIIVGGGYLERYIDLKQRLKLDSVIFTGHIENPRVAIASMDLFMLLSRAHEGISQAVLQAAYLKKPLITTDTGGLPEVCITGATGIVVPASDAKSVVEAILTLYDDPAMRREFGERGHELVKSRFLLEHTLSNMESVYQKLDQ